MVKLVTGSLMVKETGMAVLNSVVQNTTSGPSSVYIWVSFHKI